MGLIKKAIWGIVIVSILFLGMVMDSEAAMTDGLISYWDLEDDADPETDKHASNDLDYHNTPTYITTGKIGGAYKINGSGGTGTTGNELYGTSMNFGETNNTDLCFSYWINYSGTPVGYYGNIVLGDTDSYGFWGEGAAGGVNGVMFKVDGASTESSADYSLPMDNAWHHFVQCYDHTNGYIVLYVDTVVEINTSITPQSIGTIDEIYLQSGFGTNQFKYGIVNTTMIDEIGFWNRTLTSTEIDRLYNSGEGCTYPFSDCPDITNINITLTDLYTSNSITGWNTTISWPNGTAQYSETANAYQDYINVSESNITINITLNRTGYTTRTINNVAITANTTNNLAYNLTNSSPHYLSILALGTTGNNLTDVVITVNHSGESQTSNPFLHDISNYCNESTPSIDLQVNITDNTYLHRNYSGTLTISTSNRTHNITMTGNQLVLAFEQNGAASSTTGWIADQNMSHNFTNTTLLIVQQSLEEGKIEVVFNNISNWTQYYEYINDYELHINETLEILTKADWYAYIEVVDYTDEPIKDANIYAYFSLPTSLNGSAVTHKMYTRRLTLDDEPTLIWGDTASAVKIVVSKEGYEQATVLIPFADESYEKTAPLTFRLKESEGTGRDRTWLFIPRIVNELNNGLNATITAYDKTLVTITTDWRTAQGLGTKTLTKDTSNRYSFSLVCDTDYACGDDNVSIQIYIDGTLYDNITTTEYQNITERLTGTEISGLDTKILNPIMLIGLILLTAMAGSVFKNEEIGEITFKAGTIILAAISLSFAWVAVIFALEYAIKGVSKYISE